MDWLQHVPAVDTLAQIWAQPYRMSHGHARRLTSQERPPVGEWLRSPYDRDVRYARKRSLAWVGYNVQVTEGCDDDCSHLITDVHTAPASEQDPHALATIQGQLARADVLPAEPFVAAGYISAKRILHSRETQSRDAWD